MIPLPTRLFSHWPMPLKEGMLTIQGRQQHRDIRNRRDTKYKDARNVGNINSRREVSSSRDCGNSRDSSTAGTPGTSTALRTKAAAGTPAIAETWTNIGFQGTPMTAIRRNSRGNNNSRGNRNIMGSMQHHQGELPQHAGATNLATHLPYKQ
jgi:hypothetical protein